MNHQERLWQPQSAVVSGVRESQAERNERAVIRYLRKPPASTLGSLLPLSCQRYTLGEEGPCPSLVSRSPYVLVPS